MGVHRVGIQAVEEPKRWVLQFEGLEAANIQVISAVSRLEFGATPTLKATSAEDLLRLHIALQILQIQEIQVEIPDLTLHPPKLRLIVPIPA
jgi:hypothetical protein